MRISESTFFLQGVASEENELPPEAKGKRKRVLANDSSGGGPSMRRSRHTLVLLPDYQPHEGQAVPAEPPVLLAESDVLRGRVVKCTWSCHQILHLGLRSYSLVDRTGMASLLTAAWSGEADRRFYAWLLSRFRWEDMRFTFPNGKYRYFSPRTVVRTLGLRNSLRQVSMVKLPAKHRQKLTLRIRTILGIETRSHARDGGLTIGAVHDTITRMLASGVGNYHPRAFEMAFSLLVAVTCVGPKQSYSSIPWEMLHVSYVTVVLVSMI